MVQLPKLLTGFCSGQFYQLDLEVVRYSDNDKLTISIYVHRAILEITSDSTYFATLPDGAGQAECEDVACDVTDSGPDFPISFSVNPDGS